MAYTNPDAGSASQGVSYQLKLNKLVSKAKGTTAYTAVVSAPAISLSKLAQRMVDEGSSYKVRDITAIVDGIAEVATKYLNEGYAVNLGSICRFRPSIKGTTATADAALTDTENPVVVTCSAGTMIRDVALQASKIRIGVDDQIPSITGVRDSTTSMTTVITSQGNFMVSGTNLSWDTTAADEGFFVSVNGEETKATLVDADIGAMILLKNEATFTSAGDTITLIFRKKTTDGTLKQYTYDGSLVTSLAE